MATKMTVRKCAFCHLSARHVARWHYYGGYIVHYTMMCDAHKESGAMEVDRFSINIMCYICAMKFDPYDLKVEYIPAKASLGSFWDED
jgi:hypothetical protein